jgi:hypothetical protein
LIQDISIERRKSSRKLRERFYSHGSDKQGLSYVDGYAIDNYDLLRAIRNLSLYEHQSNRGQAKQLRRVNYEALDVEELGSIYESLFDFHPQILLPPFEGRLGGIFRF